MADDLDLMQLARTGELLATVDDVEYHAVHLVFAWHPDDVPSLYCQYQDWQQSHAAKLAAKDRELNELAATLERWAAKATEQARRAEIAEARIKELESLVAATPETPLRNQERMLQAQQAALDGNPGPCPDCGKNDWKNARALQMHRQRAHQGMQTPQQVDQSKQFVEELGWRCAAKGCSGAHARSLHDPAFCTLHAQRQITNGVEAAA